MRKISYLILATTLFLLGQLNDVKAAITDSVPSGHWAYESIQELSKYGIIKPEEAERFNGKKDANRFEIASMLAGVLARIEENAKNKDYKITDKTEANISKLAMYFSDELELMAIKYKNLNTDLGKIKEDVDSLKFELEEIQRELEGNTERVKIGGDFLTRSTDLNYKHGYSGVHQAAQLLRFRFMINISDDIKAVARWRLLNGLGNSGTWIGRNHSTGISDLAFLQIKNKLGGDFLLGRTFEATGHSLLINQYVDVARYTRVEDDITYQANSYFKRKNDKDTNQIWNFNVKKTGKKSNYYIDIYGQTGPEGYDMVQKAVNAAVSDSSRYDLEVGSKGHIGNSGKYSYDLSAVFTKLKQDYNNSTKSLDDSGCIAYAALNWDSKEEIKTKIAYYYADEEAHGGLFLGGDRRLAYAPETPLEDITRLDNLMLNMRNFIIDGNIHNMQDIKIQLEYKARSMPKHYLRLACDFLDNVKDNMTNALGTENGKARVLTAEYRYKINNSIIWKSGYTNFKYDGWADSTHTAKAGYGTILENGNPKDRDYGMFWSELYTKF